MLTSSDLALYAVSPCNSSVDALLESETGGATMLQLREKDLPADEFLEKARLLKGRLSIPLIINDNLSVALESGADGVHIGQDDGDVASARAALGPDRILGVSCTTLEQALAAQAAGADYLGVGAVFPTSSKDDAAEVPMNTLRAICASVHIPVVAIGGISLDNAPQLAGTGIAGVAVISALFGGGDVAGRTRRMGVAVSEMLREPVPSPVGLILDMDGVVLDSMPTWMDVDRRFLSKYGMLSDERLHRVTQCGTMESAMTMLCGEGLPLSVEEACAELHDMLDHAYLHEIPLFPSVRPFLEQARKDHARVLLLSATPESLIRPALKRLGVLEYFDEIVGEADKHTPQPFYQAAEKLGVGIGSTLVVDDSVWACECAHKAGFQTRLSL